mgnify:CR=1 FL=1
MRLFEWKEQQELSGKLKLLKGKNGVLSLFHRKCLIKKVHWQRRSEQDAEECESEALLRAWNSIPPARPERLCAYLCRIARRLALDRYDYNNADKRRAETLPIEELAEYIGGSGDAADRLSERELTGLLNGFLRGQDKTTRVIFMRRFWFGDTTAGIAERLHVSESMVKSRISRTLKKLREYLRKEGYDL